MSSIQNMMSAMGYTRLSTHDSARCGNCVHANKKPQWLRCDKGAFIVSPAGSCREYQVEPAPAVAKVCIGPTDI